MPATILLVEDEPAIQELIAANLMRAGHHVLRAGDAETAQRIVREQPDDAVLALRKMLAQPLNAREVT